MSFDMNKLPQAPPRLGLHEPAADAVDQHVEEQEEGVPRRPQQLRRSQRRHDAAREGGRVPRRQPPRTRLLGDRPQEGLDQRGGRGTHRHFGRRRAQLAVADDVLERHELEQAELVALQRRQSPPADRRQSGT